MMVTLQGIEPRWTHSLFGFSSHPNRCSQPVLSKTKVYAVCGKSYIIIIKDSLLIMEIFCIFSLKLSNV